MVRMALKSVALKSTVAVLYPIIFMQEQVMQVLQSIAVSIAASILVRLI